MENTTTQVTNASPTSIGKLAAALSKAQGAIRGAEKNAENPFFKNSYSDLSAIWEACRKPLSENELSVSQPIDFIDGTMVLRTILMHSSGERLEGIMPMQLSEKATAQQIGSLCTYFRRYCLAAIVGVAPEDDDGNKASETPVKTPMRKWAETDPSLDKVKADATEFVRKIEMAESVGEFNKILETNDTLLKQLEKLPEWYKRTKDKIAQCKEAFELAAR